MHCEVKIRLVEKHRFYSHFFLIRLDPGGRRIRTGNVAAFIPEKNALKSAYKHVSSVESISLVAGGEPMGKHAAVQGRSFALVHAYAASKLIRSIMPSLSRRNVVNS